MAFIPDPQELLGIVQAGLVLAIPTFILIILCFVWRERALGISSLVLLLLAHIVGVFTNVWGHTSGDFLICLAAFIFALVGVIRHFRKK